MSARVLLLVVLVCAGCGKTPKPDDPPVLGEAERRAVAFLVREVPAWSKENRCYSCHNNGDAARALYVASRRGGEVPAEALADTTRWLGDPDGWKHNGGEGPFNDPVVADVQFAAALVEAMDAGRCDDPASLEKAAGLIVKHQSADGSWAIDPDAAVGSPATHGPGLATALARRVLVRAGPRFAEPLGRVDAWVRKTEIYNIPDAAGVLLAVQGADDAPAASQRQKALALLRRAEVKGGGWGPFAGSPPEVFDTAVALLALAAVDETDEVKAMRARGRAYLEETQLNDGSWPETTRPAGAESYAQRLSSTGWATLALLSTR